jgi:hypothetical protein
VCNRRSVCFAFLAVGINIDSFGPWRYGTFFNHKNLPLLYGSKSAKEIGTAVVCRRV